MIPLRFRSRILPPSPGISGLKPVGKGALSFGWRRWISRLFSFVREQIGQAHPLEFALGLISVLMVSLLLAALFVSRATAQNVSLPSPRSGFGSDEVVTSSGIRCRQAIDGGMTFDAGAVADESGEAGVYGRITIPIGAPKRIDCARLYDLEIERLKAEIEQLKGGDSSYVVE